MYVRPYFLPRQWQPLSGSNITTRPARSSCIQCLYHRPRIQQPSSKPKLQRSFHTSTRFLAETLPNHYETLNLPTNASPAQIKKQFYSLSKLHHPDHNPNNPSSAEKFVQISDAYHTLGSPQKRQTYDRDFLRRQQQGGPNYSHPQGSHSSYGARPASGLSRRRTTFRGPPPSFYKAGGYGAHEAKRASNASGGGNTSGLNNDGTYSYGQAGEQQRAQHETASGGHGPGQGEDRYDPWIPHWDREGHRRTHDNLGKKFEKARLMREAGWGYRPDELDYDQGGSDLGRFIAVLGVIFLTIAIPVSLGSILIPATAPPAGERRARKDG